MQGSPASKAAAWMMGAVVSFVAMAVAGRAIQLEMNTFELMLYRSPIGFAAVLASSAGAPGASHRSGAPAPRCTWAQPLPLRRAEPLVLCNHAIPLSQLVALEFTNPIWVALLAPFLFGER